MTITDEVRRVIFSERDREWTPDLVVERLESENLDLGSANLRHTVSAALAALYNQAYLDRLRRGVYVAAPENVAEPLPGPATPGVPITGPSVALSPAPAMPRGVGTGCDPWRGRKDWFQFEARKANEIRDRYRWIVTACETPMCMAHIKVLRPVSIDYLPGICVYCGLLADTKDHLVPRGWSGDVERSWVLTVPACRECNSAINSKWAPTVTERRVIAHKFIRRRYQKYLGRKAFTPDDLAEMGPNLRSVIEASYQIGEVTHGRLAWPPYETYDIEAAHRSGIDDPHVFGLIR